MSFTRAVGTLAALLGVFSIIQAAAAESDAYKVPVITSLNYAKARLMLIQAGWQPVPTAGTNDELWGQAKVFQDAGFREINDCAGTGTAPCIMYFRDIHGKLLKVVTQGQATLEGADFPVIDNYQLVDRLPTMGEPTDMPIQTPPKLATVTPASASNESKLSWKLPWKKPRGLRQMPTVSSRGRLPCVLPSSVSIGWGLMLS